MGSSPKKLTKWEREWQDVASEWVAAARKVSGRKDVSTNYLTPLKQSTAFKRVEDADDIDDEWIVRRAAVTAQVARLTAEAIKSEVEAVAWTAAADSWNTASESIDAAIGK